MLLPVRPGLRIETVSDSGHDAHGQIASGTKPLFWKALRNESQEVSDPGRKEMVLFLNQSSSR